jgi:hypothetical protein
MVPCSGSIQQAYNDRIDDLGLLIFLGGIDHVMLDLHRFEPVFCGLEPKPRNAILKTPNANQIRDLYVEELREENLAQVLDIGVAPEVQMDKT